MLKRYNINYGKGVIDTMKTLSWIQVITSRLSFGILAVGFCAIVGWLYEPVEDSQEAEVELVECGRNLPGANL